MPPPDVSEDSCDGVGVVTPSNGLDQRVLKLVMQRLVTSRFNLILALAYRVIHLP